LKLNISNSKTPSGTLAIHGGEEVSSMMKKCKIRWTKRVAPWNNKMREYNCITHRLAWWGKAKDRKDYCTIAKMDARICRQEGHGFKRVI
jgi:hypothetical protein